MREQIWPTLVNLKFKSYCLDLILEKFQKHERYINVFLAVASSGSIAAWAIWNVYPLLWGGIIALSQVVTVIKPYFPFYRHIKEINSKCSRLELLHIELEHLWYKVQHEKITEDECSDQFFSLKKQSVDILNFADDTIFDVSPSLEKVANERMDVYLKTNYNLTNTIN